jgi:hypothetical protein
MATARVPSSPVKESRDGRWGFKARVTCSMSEVLGKPMTTWK